MAVPFRRTSKTKKRMRRTHLKKEVETTTKCSNCGATIKPHRACASCGYYKGKDVLNKTPEVVEEKPKKEKAKPAKKEKVTKKETKETKEK